MSDEDFETYDDVSEGGPVDLDSEAAGNLQGPAPGLYVFTPGAPFENKHSTLENLVKAVASKLKYPNGYPKTEYGWKNVKTGPNWVRGEYGLSTGMVTFLSSGRAKFYWRTSAVGGTGDLGKHCMWLDELAGDAASQS